MVLKHITKEMLQTANDTLKKQVQQLNKELAGMYPDEENGSVKFVRSREQLNSVIVVTPRGRFIVSATDWVEAICIVSAGGNNGENQAAIRKVHLG